MTLGEAAESLGVPPPTADRHWAFAQAWLADALSGGWASRSFQILSAHYGTEWGIGRGLPNPGGETMPDADPALMTIFIEALDRIDPDAPPHT